jgi:hypothetical protein
MAWLALIGMSGCSLALDGPKPNRPKGYAPKCDDSKGLVVADGLLATASGIGMLSAFGNDEVEAGVVLGLIGVAFTASAVRGNGVVNECNAEKALFAQEGAPSFDPPNEQPSAPAYAGARPARTPPTSAPIATLTPPPPVAPSAPNDPYVEPPRPATSAPAVIKPATAKPAPAPAAAEADPEAWRDFWTEVP